MATQRYFGADYFGADYFSDQYFSAGPGTSIVGQIAATTELDGPAPATGSYWSSKFWGSNYWSGNYWKLTEGAGGSTLVGDFAPASEIIGVINAQTDVTADFDGSVGQVELFDLEVGFSVRWAFEETSTYTGTIEPTLTALSSAFSGIFTADVIGTIDAQIAAHTSDFNGTHVAPANTTGVISTELDPLEPAISGFTIATGNIGTIAATTGETTIDLDGQVSTSDTDGVIGATTNSVDCNITGVFADSGVVIGATISDLAPVVGIFSGSSEYEFRVIESERDQDTLREGTRVGSRKGRSRVSSRRKLRA